MRKILKSGIKIYGVLFIYILLSTLIYAIYIYTSKNSTNLIIDIIIMASSFLLIGFFYGNASQKKGLIIGLIVGVIHFIFLYLLKILLIDDSKFELILFIINCLASTAGGIIGINIKKIF